MNIPARLGLFGATAALLFVGSAALGAAIGPEPTTPDGHAEHQESTMLEYRIDSETSVVRAGRPQDFRFRVLDPDGDPVTRFELRHERRLHLIVVSNDLTRYAHLHPDLDDRGEWTVELPALSPGGYRVIADTAPTGGPELKLAAALLVPGIETGAPLPAPTDSVVVDDLTVDLELTRDDHDLRAELIVRRAEDVIDPDPYLGARGHLVAMSVGDLRYLHVHPDETRVSGPVSFVIAEPQPGRYRLFFDFSVGGTVRTAAFTVDVATADAVAPGTNHGAHA